MQHGQELNWISTHQEELEPYAGKWVVILDDAIIAVGNTAQEALDYARQKTTKTPFLVKVPRKDEGLYVLSWNSLTSTAGVSTTQSSR